MINTGVRSSFSGCKINWCKCFWTKCPGIIPTVKAADREIVFYENRHGELAVGELHPVTLESLPAIDPKGCRVCWRIKGAESIAVTAEDQFSASQLWTDGVWETQAICFIDGMIIKLEKVMAKFSCVYFFSSGVCYMERNN